MIFVMLSIFNEYDPISCLEFNSRTSFPSIPINIKNTKKGNQAKNRDNVGLDRKKGKREKQRKMEREGKDGHKIFKMWN